MLSKMSMHVMNIKNNALFINLNQIISQVNHILKV